jgi:hypothetical protein
MALSKKSIDIGVLLQSQTYTDQNVTDTNSIEYTLTIQNKDIQIEPEFWGGGAFDETIGAKRISNLRGYRVRLSLNFNASMEYALRQVSNSSATGSTYREMFNDILYCFTNDQLPGSTDAFVGLNLKVRTDAGISGIPRSNTDGTFMNFIPEEMSYNQQYSNQIGRFVPRMTFVSERLMATIPEALEGVL